MPLDPNQRKDVRRAEKLAAAREAARIEYTRRIMSEALGREWMHDLLERCHVFHTPFAPGRPDQTAYNCGEQNIGYITFRDVVVYCPTEYVMMMQEASHRELTYGRREPKPTDTAGERSGGSDAGRDVEGPEPDLDESVWGPETRGEAGSGAELS